MDRLIRLREAVSLTHALPECGEEIQVMVRTRPGCEVTRGRMVEGNPPSSFGIATLEGVRQSGMTEGAPWLPLRGARGSAARFSVMARRANYRS